MAAWQTRNQTNPIASPRRCSLLIPIGSCRNPYPKRLAFHFLGFFLARRRGEFSVIPEDVTRVNETQKAAPVILRIIHKIPWIGFHGKILTGNHRFSHEIWGFPVNVPLNQSIEKFHSVMVLCPARFCFFNGNIREPNLRESWSPAMFVDSNDL